MYKYGISDPALARRVKLVKVTPCSYDVQLDGVSIGGMWRQILFRECGSEWLWWGYIYYPIPADILTADRDTQNGWLLRHYGGNIATTRREIVLSLLKNHQERKAVK